MPKFHFDRLSFIIGFISASLFWYIVSRIRTWFPIWRNQIRRSIQRIQQHNLEGAVDYLRKEAVRQAQRKHLAASLFSLDEVLIEPRLIAPLPIVEPGTTPPPQPVAGQIVPYTPDWPELATPLGVPTITLAEALQNGSHIVVTGQPGSGKTVALAHLAALIGRQDPAAGNLQNKIPFLIHILDLDTTLVDGQDPIENLSRAITSQSSLIWQPQVSKLLKILFSNNARNSILFVDGLDELHSEAFDAAAAYLKALLSAHPNLQVVVTASPNYLGSLTQAGFYPLGIAAWTRTQRKVFTQRWADLWTAHLSDLLKKQPEQQEILAAADFDPLLMTGWLEKETSFATPLEWTLRVWGAFSGDLAGNNLFGMLDSHIVRYLPSPALAPALERLAQNMVKNHSIAIDVTEAAQILDRARGTGLASVMDDASRTDIPGDDESAAEPNPSAQRQQVKLPQSAAPAANGSEILKSLINGGILIEHSRGQIRFASPVFAGYLAGMNIPADDAAQIAESTAHGPEWPIHTQVLQTASACNDDTEWIYSLIDAPEAPLYRNLLIAARWLREAPAGLEWRTKLMRSMVGLIISEAVPVGTRARLIAAFLRSGDPSTPKLLKQLMISPSPSVRKLALMACGAYGSSQLIQDISGLLSDSVPQVRYAACLALSAIPGDASLKALVEILLHGEEEMRQAAAEALARNEPDGHEILREAAGLEEDLLTRRAAVFGLLQVHQDWARKLLEKVAVEDGQWVVRNAAAEALQRFQEEWRSIPAPQPPPAESPWLITFASKLGKAIAPDQPAVDILLLALKSGSVDEQIGALQYLRETPDEGVVGEIYHALYGGQEELHEPALAAIHWMSASGAKLPSPTVFGLG